ncbi:tetratricopeptide repeat protein [Methylobacterium oxalidis]|uniref:tetratricopeptide repeat protein n=1 Tax=Methylobacterium oxalidis TaxID=944322 RepID=UPI003314CB3E
MSARSALALSALLLCGTTLGIACGPDFPWQLLTDRVGTLRATPANSFAFEASQLVSSRGDKLHAVEFERDQDALEAREAAEAADLTDDQDDALHALRKAPVSDPTLGPASKLPAAVRLYEAGAVDFTTGDTSRAAERFAEVLKLPAPDARPRATWAAFMLGRCLAKQGDPSGAAQAFARTRSLALEGAPDPLGLAVASYGEEARLHLIRAQGLTEGEEPLKPEATAEYAQEIGKATTLYAEQAARGSGSGRQSLRMVAQHVLKEPERITAAARDPLVQRLLVAYVLARVSDLPEQTPHTDAGQRKPGVTPNPVLITLVDAIEQGGLKQVSGAERLAALAYRTGRFGMARRLVEHASGPLAAWVRAKLALQEGDITRAASFYSEASRAFPADGSEGSVEAAQKGRLTGESAVLALSRGEYVEALRRLYPLAHTYWGDAVHIAERVLTADELKAFVERAAGWEKPAALSSYDKRDLRQRLRDLLARRLVREGRPAEALPYFGETETAAQVKEYDEAVRTGRGDTGSSNTDRAHAWYRAAVLARNAGMTMMGYEGPPDYAVNEGTFGWGYGQKQVGGGFVSGDERARFVASVAHPEKRYHYRYVATDHVSRAADLLPPRSQAFAAVLCVAAGWMKGSPGGEDRYRDLYARYVAEGPYVSWAEHFGEKCPEPDFEAAAAMAAATTLRRNLDPMKDWVRPILRSLKKAPESGAVEELTSSEHKQDHLGIARNSTGLPKTEQTNTALLRPSAGLMMDGREFLTNWRSHIGERVTLNYCTLRPAQASGILCMIFSGSVSIGIVMLQVHSIDPTSLAWARTTCDKPRLTTTCSVGVTGIVRDQNGPSIDEAVIQF